MNEEPSLLREVKSEYRRSAAPTQQQPLEVIDLCSSSEEEERPVPHVPRVASQPTAHDVEYLTHKIAQYTEEEEKHTIEGLPLDKQDAEGLVGCVVRYMLFHQFEKPWVPVTHVKVREVLMKEFVSKSGREDLPGSSKIPSVIIPMAQKRMLTVFGIEMLEVERQTESSKQKGSRQYVLHSALPAQMRSVYVPDQTEPGSGPDLALATVVLAFIDLAGGKLEEEEMWERLSDLGLQKTQPHPYFGDPIKAVQKLEAARFVIRHQDKRQAGESGGRLHMYTRGECGQDRLGGLNVKAFIDQLYKKQVSRSTERRSLYR